VAPGRPGVGKPPAGLGVGDAKFVRLGKVYLSSN